MKKPLNLYFQVFLAACVIISAGCSPTIDAPKLEPEPAPTWAEKGGATPAEHQAIVDAYKPDFAPDFERLEAAPGVEPVNTTQQNDVVVKPNALLYDAVAHPEVLNWEPGRIVVSAPAESGAIGNNRLGFARRVTGVTLDGEFIVVSTEMPRLDQIVSGQLLKTFDFSQAQPVDLTGLDPEYVARTFYTVDTTELGTGLDDFVYAYKDPVDEQAVLQTIQAAPWGLSSVVKWVDKKASEVKDVAVSTVTTVASSVGNAAAEAARIAAEVAARAAADAARAAAELYERMNPKRLAGAGTIDRDITFGLPSALQVVPKLTYEKTVNAMGKLPMKLSVEAEAKMNASLTFNPGLQIGMDIPNPTRISDQNKNVMLSVNVDALSRFKVEVESQVAVGVASAEGLEKDALKNKINSDSIFAQKFYNESKERYLGDRDVAPVGGWKKTLYLSAPYNLTIWAGPVPIVFTSTFQLDAECGFEAKATLNVNAKLERTERYKFKADLDTGSKNLATSAGDITRAVTHDFQVLGGGQVQVSCGLIPRLNLYSYDMVGINAGVRASAVVKAAYASKCEDNKNDWRPNGKISFGVYGNVGIQAGGRVQVPGSSYLGKGGQELGIDIGPLELKNWEFPIYEKEWDRPRGGLGYCKPTCTNNGIDGEESDIDCGGGCATKCAIGKNCKSTADCNNAYCSNGVCGTDHCNNGLRDGDEAAIDCGGTCGKCAVGKMCTKGGDCVTGFCAVKPGTGGGIGACTQDHCSDSFKDADETGIDCGGSTCAKCANGVASIASGCMSGISDGINCVADLCRSGRKDADETDRDCGGPSCNKCGANQACVLNTDCSSAAPICQAGKCSRAQCTNGTKDGDESDLDCGGSCSSIRQCDLNKICRMNSDCAGALGCIGGVCKAPSCSDGVKNGLESDVDCGGTCQNKCVVGKRCATNLSCQSNVCNNAICDSATCGNRRKDGTETDVDCGGSCQAKCLQYRSCTASTDCAASAPVCNARTKTCGAPSCFDGIMNQNETDIDCGGPTCAGCGPNQACQTGTDCGATRTTRFSCIANICKTPSCTDGVANGQEPDIDCGRTCSAKCAASKRCFGNQDCVAGNDCAANKCIPHACNDTRKNGQESDIDCGGICAIKCALGKTCNAVLDCEDGLDCITGKCTQPSCTDNKKNGFETDLDCGGSCSAKCSNGKGCLIDVDCGTGLSCHPGLKVCTVANCTDNGKNGGESDVDCGGPCPAKCADGKMCNTGIDCSNLACTVNICTAPSCSDGVKNGSESDLDCGGMCATKCATAKRCVTGVDCTSKVCANNLCVAASCTDAVKNGTETDIDCGGSCTNKCAATKACSVAGDCQDGICQQNICLAASCSDTVKNGGEADVDCGRVCSVKCASSKMCAGAIDCVSGVCTGFLCQSPTCIDTVKNGTESDVDCGGTCSSKCATNKICSVSSDCQNSVCQNMVCTAPTCVDTVKNGGESDIDCGRVCNAKCVDGKVCAGGIDCVSGVCTGLVCQTPTCVDTVKNGTESDVDCGGSCSSKCIPGKACGLSADCTTSVCSNSVCQVESCSDGVRNGTETGLDCGGTCSTKCPTGQGCAGSIDCLSGVCTALVCQAASCTDAVKNGNESDVDCGGSNACSRCVTGKACLGNTDCASASCSNNVCSAANTTVGQWEFDGFGSDQSGFNHPITTTAGATFTTADCKSGSGCLAFNGSTGAEVTAFDLGANFTLGGWVNLNSPVNAQINTIMATSTAGLSADGFKLFVNTFGTNDRALHFESGDGTSGCGKFTAAGAVPAGRWAHIAAAVSSTGAVSLYVNGALQSLVSGACNNAGFSKNKQILLGQTPGPFFRLNGKLDRSFITNYVMTAPEVAAAMNEGSLHCTDFPCIFQGGTSNGNMGGKPGADALCANSVMQPAGKTAVAFASFSTTTEVRDLGNTAIGYNDTVPMYAPNGLKLSNSLTDLLDYTLCVDGCVNFANGAVTSSNYWNFSDGSGTFYTGKTCQGGTSALAADTGMLGAPTFSFVGQFSDFPCNTNQAFVCLAY
jgi:hypothetical protein